MKFSKYALFLLALATPATLAQEPEAAAERTNQNDTTMPTEEEAGARIDTDTNAPQPPTAVENETPVEGGTLTAKKPTVANRKAGSIADVIGDEARFSILAKAVEAAGMNEELEKTGVRTFFAPTNEAFEKLPDGAIGELLMPENKTQLRALLRYHLVEGDVLTMALRGLQEVKSAGGEKLDVEIGNDKKQVNDADIGVSMATETNGVILAVDEVLVPESLDGFAQLER